MILILQKGDLEMQNYDFIFSRRSIRKYKNKEIPEKDIKLILEAARHAPSPYDYTTWHLILIKEKLMIQKIMGISGGQSWIQTASLIVVGIVTPKKGTLKWKTVDVTIALQNIALISEALGYGSCWVGYFKEKKLKELLGIPEDNNVLAFITIGVKDEIPKERYYEELSNLVSTDIFTKKY